MMMQAPAGKQTYTIYDPTGRELQVELEREPTPDEVKAIFDRYDQTRTRPQAPPELVEGAEVPSNVPGRSVAFGGPMRQMLQGAYATPEQQAERKAAFVDALPAVAATAATMAPPVAAAAGLGGLALRAGAAGAAGMATAGATGSDLWDAFTEGATQAAAQLGGEALGKGMVAFGQRMYSGFLKPSRAVRREFPKVAEQLYEQGRGITQESLDAANDTIDALRTEVDDAIVQGARKGVPSIDAVDLMMAYQEMMDYADTVVANKSQGPAIKQAIDKEFQYLARQLGKGVDVVDAQKRKRFFQSQADAAYEAVRRGQKSQLGWRDLMNMSVARELQNAIERRVPEVLPLNRQIQQQIGQARALSDAIGRIDNHMPFGSVSDVVSISSGMASGSAATGLAAKLASTAQTGQALATGMGKLGRNVNLPLALRLGQIVTVGDQKLRVTKVSPDGNWEGVVVK
jgi:hypothetical protein